MSTSPETSHLCLLPTELVIQIFSDLDIRSLLVCKQVCRLFKDIIVDAAAIQYKIELLVSGMDDGPPSGMSAAERLQMLKRHRNAWNNLRFSSEKTIPMLKGEVWELYGGVLSQARGPQSLAFKQLPSVIRGIEEKEWIVQDLEFRIRDFGMDPSQDLLVVIESHSAHNQAFCIHLLNLYTGTPHTSAPHPAILEHIPSGDNYSYAIQISAQFLGVLFISGNDNDSELLVWNWRTGSRHLWLCGPDSASFTFLSDRHIIIGAIDRDDDELHERQPEPELIVMDFLNTSGEKIITKSADFLCAFHFPLLSYWATPLAMSIRSDPAPSWRPNPDLQVPFYAAKNDRLFVITFWMADALTVRTFLLFVPSSTISSHLDSMTLGETKHHVTWEEWGPKGTRMIPASPGHSSVWVCYVFGMKFVSPTRTDGRKSIDIYDFNPLALRRSEGGPTPMVNETAMQNGRIFQHEVTTSLPYRRWTLTPPALEGERDFDAVMLSEDTLLTVSSESNVRWYRILTL